MKVNHPKGTFFINNRGMATIMTLVLLPLLISAAGVAAAALIAIKQVEETQHLCRLLLLKTQNKVKRDLEKLLKLNRQAARLRLRRQRAEVAVAAAASKPLMLPAALARLKAVIGRQVILSSKQKALISHARHISLMAPQTANSEIRSSLNQSIFRRLSGSGLRSEMNQKQSGARTPTPFRSEMVFGRFELTAIPPLSLTPDYHPAPLFSQTQSIGIKWRVDAMTFLPSWIATTTATQRKTYLHGQCMATLVKRKGQWQSSLKMAKR